ncbi:male-specific opa-containing protein-like isoform X1 [Helicoverpa armigera]|uniref:male-specific opa-containing protein-like isoform X1 n=1 Tax=Helicoverpa armigera TaxID=29058 RepID=UPI0030839941
MKSALAFLIVGAVLVCVHARPADDPAAAATTPAGATTPAAPAAPAATPAAPTAPTAPAAPAAPDAGAATTPATDPQPNCNKHFRGPHHQGRRIWKDAFRNPYQSRRGFPPNMGIGK